MSTPEDLSRSYDEHMRIFEARLDSVGGRTPPKRSSMVLSPVQQGGRARSVSKSSVGIVMARRTFFFSRSLQSSPTRDRANSRLSPTTNAVAMRANSQPGEVIIGFAAPETKSGSPEELSLSRSQERSMSMMALSSPPKLTQDVVPPPASEPAKPKTTVAKTAAKGGAADARGPKVDMKNLSKAERREMAQKQQELNNARKQGKGGGGGGGKGKADDKAAPQPQQQQSQQQQEHRKRSVEKEKSATALQSTSAKSASLSSVGPAAIASGNAAAAGGAGAGAVKTNRVPFLMHLPDYVARAPSDTAQAGVHAEIVRLGAKYVDGTIRGSAARCVALVVACKSVVSDFKLPPRTDFAKHFAEYLGPMLKFIFACRPKSVSMANFVRAFKNKGVECRGKSESEGKQLLEEFLDEFLDERLLTAEQMICDYGVKKIANGDVIISFACSFVVSKLLVAAHNAGKRFRLIIVDSTPLLEGKEFLKRMTLAGIQCTYVLLNAVCYMMKEVTKVLVGAYAMLSNGNLVSRAGTALVAMAAHEYNVPVIVCCETLKFSEKTMLDSITWNELGNADDVARGATSLTKWRDVPGLTLLSLLYDVTPMEFITMVVCEFGLIPPTSVPVILREYGNKKEEDKN